MASIYIHVPFCKSRCIYCGFFSTTSLARRDEYVEAVCGELLHRKDYLKGEDVETIYFGGGTPSQLSIAQISRILETIFKIYNVRANAEVTLEGNPDDLTLPYLQQLRKLGFNRLSMGVQSFDAERLSFIRRRHTASQAVSAVYDAREAGFTNLSIDLMFGFPGQSLDDWKKDVDKALSLPVTHISAYSLMYDEGTVLADMLDRGDIEEIDEELSLQMYKYLVKALKDAGFEHYEISNFCRPGCMSRHNSGYWRGVAYLGVGAGAHSYDGVSRQYNVESLDAYINGASPESESLTRDERYNEFVFTALRTHDGMHLAELKRKFGEKYYDYCMKNAKKHLGSGLLHVTEGADSVLRLTSEGIYISNDIMSELMKVD